MASRQEEKEARRRAREEAEAADRKAHQRNRRLQLVFGGLLTAAVIAGIVVLLIGGGDNGTEHEATGGATQASADGVTLPEQQITDLDEAVKAAGCKIQHPANEGSTHEDRVYTAEDYKTNPPNSGPHTPQPATDGVYEPGNPPEVGPSVHSLEHGRINVQYSPDAPPEVVEKLEAFVAENGGYHMLLFENQTGMDAQVAATAWNQVLTCDELTDETFDALRTFRDRYIDKGPEQVP